MIPKECKRLAEVDFPIAEVSRHSESSSRQGHPSTLHLWWARRPLAACRAMLMALLLPDPADNLCPDSFKQKARVLLPELVGTIKADDFALRKALLRFIADFARWDKSAHPAYLNVGRGLVKAAYPEETPLVVDPFAGGGSIPLEALRIGCDSFASDLNPVACLILRTLLEDLPNDGHSLAEELNYVGESIQRQLDEQVASIYRTRDADLNTIAYLWARTVQCESPNCGAEIPLIRSFWLCKKAHKKKAIRYNIVRSKNRSPHLEFEMFTPKNDAEVPPATVANAKATCPCCKAVLPAPRVRAQLKAQRGGADVEFDRGGNRLGGARMIAVVFSGNDRSGRQYRMPDNEDYAAVFNAQERLRRVESDWRENGQIGYSPVPDETISLNEIRRISVPLYGVTTWGDIFTSRQKLFLYTISESIKKVDASASCRRMCALALDRLVMISSAHCRWKPTGESLIDMFGRHALGMVWDFAESHPGMGESSSFRGWIAKLSSLSRAISSQIPNAGQVEQSDATHSYLPDESCQIWFTDPPYYDSIPYSHLSDSFYVWLKRCLPTSLISSDLLTPKDNECVVDRPHKLSNSTKNEAYFEGKITEAAAVGRRILNPSGCASIVFAHKTTEGWEALLSGIIRSKWCITASWPIATELKSRLNARDTASLNTSVHIVCRPRDSEAIVGDWSTVLQELPKRIASWMNRLQDEGIRGADLVFACIGPALEIYSRYSRVETADGKEVKLDTYLEKVWEVVGRIALENVLGTDEAQARNGMAGVLEEDARLTALFLWTLQSTESDVTSNGAISDDNDQDDDADDEEEVPTGPSKGFSLVFDVVIRFTRPLGIHIDTWEGRIIETKKGVVRLMSVTERAKALFGDAGASAVAYEIETDPAKAAQFELSLGVVEAAPKIKSKGRRGRPAVDVTDDDFSTEQQVTTLDRVHAAMLLQKAGRANALRALLKAEQQRGSDFLRLANALSALYPKSSEEKRLLDAMLLAVPR